MSETSKPTILPHFGHYFAGIADGEGHFSIRKHHARSGYACAFILIMRDDDREFVEWLRDTTGLGVIYATKARQKIGHMSKPQVQWQVNTKSDCSALADIFERYPLHTRKARDCAIWISAVRYQASDRPYGWAPMARWFELIKETRAYDGGVEVQDEPLDILSLFPDEAWAGNRA